MPYQRVSTHADLILHAEVHNGCTAVERDSYICTAGLGLYHGSIRLCFVFALDAVVILDDICCDRRILNGSAVENIAHPEVIRKLVLQTLFSSCCIHGLVILFAGDLYIVKCKVIGAFGGNSQPEFIAVLRCLVVGGQSSPLSCLHRLGIQFHDGLLIGFLIQAKQGQVEHLIRGTVNLHAVVVVLAALQVQALGRACAV